MTFAMPVEQLKSQKTAIAMPVERLNGLCYAGRAIKMGSVERFSTGRAF
jgi:hypothetical protein